MKDKLEDCNCIYYKDKIKIIGSLHNEIDRLEKGIKKPDTSEAVLVKFKDEIIPEYNDLIERVENTPDCKV